MAVLVINCGSSSVKFAIFGSESPEPLVQGIVERVGSPEVGASIRRSGGGKEELALEPGADHASALATVFEKLGDLAITTVGHRVVHGGAEFSEPVLIDDDILRKIGDLAPLAPSHAIPNALGIEAARRVFPGIPQVAVFDTAFHQTIAPEVHRYAIPSEYYENYRIRRYGFHGTSHAWVAAEAAKVLELPPDRHRLITAHLGNGCSATAVVNGHSVDTTMGLTPLEGLVMGTRSGHVDPNLHSFLARQAGMSLDEISDLLNHRSGLAGLSGISGDLRQLSAAFEQGDERAKLALGVFTFRLAREIGGLMVSLGGPADALVFTGGIGENSSLVRRWTVERLAHFGFGIDETLNATPSVNGLISPPDQFPAVLVIRTNEELAIATAARNLTRI